MYRIDRWGLWRVLLQPCVKWRLCGGVVCWYSAELDPFLVGQRRSGGSVVAGMPETSMLVGQR
ncbi:hypothetical protein C5E45_23830 [Nocardia nova]|uniref:Uncharacterized protein n=1 Tax=Nocardia nova TaxID=37330 RepID=A0A2S6AKT1_9NOCA|nr:hypothetical protein C5E45_23830 [Nocardia nova]